MRFELGILLSLFTMASAGIYSRSHFWEVPVDEIEVIDGEIELPCTSSYLVYGMSRRPVSCEEAFCHCLQNITACPTDGNTAPIRITVPANVKFIFMIDFSDNNNCRLYRPISKIEEFDEMAVKKVKDVKKTRHRSTRSPPHKARLTVGPDARVLPTDTPDGFNIEDYVN